MSEVSLSEPGEPPVPVVPLRAADAAGSIGSALREVGFLSLTDHGVPASLIADAYAAATAFFARPDDQKRRFAVAGSLGQRGLHRHRRRAGRGGQGGGPEGVLPDRPARGELPRRPERLAGRRLPRPGRGTVRVSAEGRGDGRRGGLGAPGPRREFPAGPHPRRRKHPAADPLPAGPGRRGPRPRPGRRLTRTSTCSPCWSGPPPRGWRSNRGPAATGSRSSPPRARSWSTAATCWRT